MSKVLIFMMTLTGIMFLLSRFGYIDGTTQGILSAINVDGDGIKWGELFSAALNIFTVSGLVTGIIVGYLASRAPESAVKAGFAGLILGWLVSDITSLYTRASEIIGSDMIWLEFVIKGVVIVLMAGLAVSIISWWAGQDG